MNLFSIAGLIIGASSTCLGLFTLFLARKKIHYLWSIFCFSVAIWGLGGLMIGQAQTTSQAIFWWKTSYVGVIFIPALYFYFVQIFLKISKRVLTYGIFFISFLFLYLNLFTNLFISNVRFVFGEFYYLSSPSFFYNAFVLMFFSLVVYDFYLLLTNHKKKQGLERSQIKYFLVTIPLCFGGGLFAFFPVYNIDIYPVMNVAIAIFPFVIVYAMFRHKLMDVRVIIQRGFIYSILLSFIIGFYIVLLFILSLFFQQKTEMKILVAAGITTVFGVYSVPIIEKFFRQLTDKFFFKEKYDYTTAIYNLSEKLNKNIKLESLVNEFIAELKDILKIKNIQLVLVKRNNIFSTPKTRKKNITSSRALFDDDLWREKTIIEDIDITKEETTKGEMEKSKLYELLRRYHYKEGVQVFVAIKLKDELKGVMMLGDKKSGDIYSQEDLSLLRTVSIQAAVAIEKAQLYEKIKNYSLELEKKVIKRTAKIKNLQEEQKQTMLEIAHGLQTPLTILKSELSIVQNQKIDEKMIREFTGSIDRISQFIYDMLRLSKLESDSKLLKLKKLNLSEILNELIESFEIIAQDKGINIKHDIEKNIMINGERRKLEELVTNFVSNSVKYMRTEGRKEISIKLSKNKNLIELVVADTGTGIKKENIDKLFQRFYRADEAGRAAKQGTGLGLAICKEIIDIHRGKVEVESNLGQGTSFKVFFPLAEKFANFR